MYAYCNGNPVMHSDSNGQLGRLVKAVVGAVVEAAKAVVGAVANTVTDAMPGIATGGVAGVVPVAQRPTPRAPDVIMAAQGDTNDSPQLAATSG